MILKQRWYPLTLMSHSIQSSTTSPVISPLVVTNTCTLGIHTYYSANYSSPSTTQQTVHSQPAQPPPPTQQPHITSPQITSVLTQPCTSPNPLFQLIASGQCNTVSPVLQVSNLQTLRTISAFNTNLKPIKYGQH